ncbi:hypothetical protein SLE2022_189880 [Rubroshorea leprosula]
MRYPWRLLLLRSCPRSRFPILIQSQVLSDSVSSFSSLLHTQSFHNASSQSYLSNPQNRKLATNSLLFMNHKNLSFSNFSSEPAVEQKDPDHALEAVIDIFNKYRDGNDIAKELEVNGVVISHDLVLKVLRNLESNPDVARRFFDWVLESDGERLSSKSYNLMLGILGVNGLVEEFWVLVDAMKKKGYGVSGRVRDKVAEIFEKEGLDSDLEKLKGVFASGSLRNLAEKVCSRVGKIVRSEVWGENVEGRLRDLNVAFSSDQVKMILENLGAQPTKALIFFRWVEESGLVKHDEGTYNAMARVLGREDCIDRFWKVVDEMRSKGYEMEMETYVKVLVRFSKRKMIKDAVDLYEYAMNGANRPSVHCCTFLLRKIAVAKQLDMELFSRVLRIFTEGGNVLTDSMLDAVLKSLTSVGRLGDCNRVLQAMEEAGLVAGGNMQRKIAFRLTHTGKKEEATEFMYHIEASNGNLDHRAWASLIEGHCLAGDLEKAFDCFQRMVGSEGVSHAGYPLELLISAYCDRNRAVDAWKLLRNYVKENQLKPWHTTYKVLIRKLMVQGGFKDALGILGLMKADGFPPFVDPFIQYVSKSGSNEDAMAFLKAMTSKRFPSTSVVLRVFEAFFEAARQDEAQNLLSKCPHYIRNHADVLNLFCSMKSGEIENVAPVVA